MILQEILTLKFPNANFLNDIIIQDDGKGPYIRAWNVQNVPMPTQQDIKQWEQELNLTYRQTQARKGRKYPSWQEQLDMQYHDKKNNTTTWIDTISAIKAANPIPLE